MLAVALALASSVAIGGTDFLAGLKARQLGVLPVVVVSQVSGLLALLAACALTGEPIFSGPELLLYGTISAVGQLVAVTAFWHGLTVGAMGVVAPISATGVVIPIAVGLVEGNRPSTVQLIGIALAVGGVIVASYEPVERDGQGLPIAAGVGFALLGALGIGLFYTGLAGAAEHASALETATVNRVLSCSLALLPALVLYRRVAVAPGHLPALAAVGVLEVLGILLFAAASTEGLLTIVGPVAALYPLTTILLARFYLRERLQPTARLGALAAIAGIVVLGATTGGNG
jgi:drug/metabolite transporter (DMT)-like permease